MLKRSSIEQPWVRWSLWFGVWTIISLAFSVQLYLHNSRRGIEVPWHEIGLLMISDWYLWALLSLPIAWLARRYPFEKLGWIYSGALHGPLSLLFAMIHMLLRAVISGFTEFGRVDPISLVFIYWLIICMTQAFDYYEHNVVRALRTAELEKRLAQAQLQALQMQLNPHFLFNTLHAISSLMHQNVDAADRMIAQLGDLLRYTLESTDTQEVPLKQELDFLERYLEIEQARFGDRLTVRMAIAPDTLEASVPNLLLQPLVENAIHHGVEPHARPGIIEIRAEREQGMLRLLVTDNGNGLQNTHSSGTGIGLTNTRARLQQLYGAAHKFEFKNGTHGGVVVAVTLPYHTSAGKVSAQTLRLNPI